MRARRRVIDRSNYESQTYFQKQYVEDAIRFGKQVAEDPDRAVRLDRSLCPICHYRPSRIGGSAITSVQCGLCPEEMTFGNTAVDVLCRGCAKRNGLCKHCGADVNLKCRRKIAFDRSPDNAETLANA